MTVISHLKWYHKFLRIEALFFLLSFLSPNGNCIKNKAGVGSSNALFLDTISVLLAEFIFATYHSISGTLDLDPEITLCHYIHSLLPTSKTSKHEVIFRVVLWNTVNIHTGPLSYMSDSNLRHSKLMYMWSQFQILAFLSGMLNSLLIISALLSFPSNAAVQQNC